MKNVVTSEIYSAQNFLLALTDEVFTLNGKNDLADIDAILEEKELSTDDAPLWDFPLDEMDEIIANDLYVVPVECFYTDEDGELHRNVRLFEIPKEYIDRF